MAVTIFVNTPQVLYFSVSDFFDAVFLNFSANGFLYNYPGWNNNPNVSANEYVFWDSAHPSGKMHQLIASDFIKFLTLVGLAAHR
jgi:lysophospholipase L1-like esterase